MQSQVQSKTKSVGKLAGGKQETVQNKSDQKLVKTVTPDNDNGKPGQPVKQQANVCPPQFQDDSTSNKDQGPAGENL